MYSEQSAYFSRGMYFSPLLRIFGGTSRSVRCDRSMQYATTIERTFYCSFHPTTCAWPSAATRGNPNDMREKSSSRLRISCNRWASAPSSGDLRWRESHIRRKGAMTWWTYPFPVPIWCCTSGEPTSYGRFKSSLEIPLPHIAEIRADPAIAHGWWHGLKMPGTSIPGVLTAGTFYEDGKRVLWDVHNPENTVVIGLKNERYNELIVEVADPKAAVELVKTALPR